MDESDVDPRLLDLARGGASSGVGKPVDLRPSHVASEGGWAFLIARMTEPDGGDLDYAGTPRAEAAAGGFVSKDYAVLARRNEPGWTLVADAIGPTDATWRSWPATYGAPAGLFDRFSGSG